MMDSQSHMNHSDNPVKQKEHMDLVNLSQSLNNPVVAIKNGSWFDANTWKDNQVPDNGNDVVIADGVTVTYDNVSETRLNVMRVDGKLQFASNINTKLILDSLFVSKQAELSIGTKDNPIQTISVNPQSPKKVISTQVKKYRRKETSSNQSSCISQ